MPRTRGHRSTEYPSTMRADPERHVLSVMLLSQLLLRPEARTTYSETSGHHSRLAYYHHDKSFPASCHSHAATIQKDNLCSLPDLAAQWVRFVLATIEHQLHCPQRSPPWSIVTCLIAVLSTRTRLTDTSLSCCRLCNKLTWGLTSFPRHPLRRRATQLHPHHLRLVAKQVSPPGHPQVGHR